MAMDKAHQETDKALARLEKQLKDIYTQAYKEVKEQAAEVLAKMEFTPDMTPQQRYVLATKYDRLTKLETQIGDVLKNVNAEAVKMINDEMANVYKTNWSFMSDSVKEGVFPVLSKSEIKTILTEQITPFKKLAIDTLKDSAQIKQQLTRELVSGIMQGESIPQIAKRIRGTFESNLSRSVKIARTETTRVENSARQDVANTAAKSGLPMKKKWVSTIDDDTRGMKSTDRYDHVSANGQVVDYDEPFIVSGEELMYPGDENGSAGNVINCRCTMVSFVDKDALEKQSK